MKKATKKQRLAGIAAAGAIVLTSLLSFRYTRTAGVIQIAHMETTQIIDTDMTPITGTDTTPTTGTDKPNIIFVLTDDQRYDALGAMGNTLIRTPNMDKLARAGVLFQNGYVTTSICCVSRASLLTGQYGSRHHIDDFTTNLSAGALAKTYPALLKNAGYKLGLSANSG